MSTKKEIEESLDRARDLQDKFLPPFNHIKLFFPESFIIYLPKDIVSGDFFWFETINDISIIAVADCTGHGVSGAMLTVKCMDLLNRAVRDFGCVDPGHILDKSNNLVQREFRNYGNDTVEGMDIALCSIQNFKLKYAGANNSLWLFRENELKDFPATRQGICITDNQIPFFSHESMLRIGDIIYLLSDGFQDQIGEQVDKKYKSRNLKNFILSILDYPLNKQKDMLLHELAKWRGDNEQTDDITILAIKIVNNDNLKMHNL